MAHCIEPKISNFFDYPAAPIRSYLWRANASNPCSGSRTKTEVWIDPMTSNYYVDFERTTPINGTFFFKDNTLDYYVVITNGVAADPTNNVCPVPGVIRWKDMGRASSIDRYRNFILATYTDSHIVVKYDISTGTNPVGTIVAGRMNIRQQNTSALHTDLCFPTLVKWREDGERFVVYSAGNVKSVKVFGKNGGFIYSPSQPGYFGETMDYQWAYNTQNGYSTTPRENNGLLAKLTASDINDMYVVTTLEYYSGGTFGTGYAESIMLGITNKTFNSTTNTFNSRNEIYAVNQLWDGNLFWTTLVYSFETPISNVYNHDLIDINDTRKNIKDVIPDFCIMRKVVSGTNLSYTITFVMPRSWRQSGNDKYRYYEQIEIVVNMNISNLSSKYTSRSLTPRRIYSGSGVYKKAARASVSCVDNNIYVYVRSSDWNFWDNIDAFYTGLGALTLGAWLAAVGTAAAIYATTGTTVIFTSSLAFGISKLVVSIGGFLAAVPVVGWIALAAIVVASALVYIFKKEPRQREFGSSRLNITYGTPISYGYTGGNASASWRSIDTTRDVTMIHDKHGGTHFPLSYTDDYSVLIGVYNSDIAAGTVLVAPDVPTE